MPHTLEHELPCRDLLFHRTNIGKLLFMQVQFQCLEQALAKIGKLVELQTALLRILKHLLDEVADEGLALRVGHLDVKLKIAIHYDVN